MSGRMYVTKKKKKNVTVLCLYPSRTYYVPGSINSNTEMDKTQLKLSEGAPSFDKNKTKQNNMITLVCVKGKQIMLCEHRVRGGTYLSLGCHGDIEEMKRNA